MIASWVRPAPANPGPNGEALAPIYVTFPRAFTRQVFPNLEPARPLGQTAAGAPSVAFDGPDSAVAALRTTTPIAGVAFNVIAAESTAGGPWATPRLVAPLGLSRQDPIVVSPEAGDVEIVYSVMNPIASPPTWFVTADEPTGSQPLGTTTDPDDHGVAVALGPAHVLVAWVTANGVQLVERA